MVFGANFQFVSGPVLAISRLGVTGVQLKWPTNADNYQVESTGSLSVPVWSPVTNSPTVIGGEFVTLLTNLPGEVRYFRLVKP
jgi:hypothetical protein